MLRTCSKDYPKTGVELRINRDTIFSADCLYKLWKKGTSLSVFCSVVRLT